MSKYIENLTKKAQDSLQALDIEASSQALDEIIKHVQDCKVLPAIELQIQYARIKASTQLVTGNFCAAADTYLRCLSWLLPFSADAAEKYSKLFKEEIAECLRIKDKKDGTSA